MPSQMRANQLGYFVSGARPIWLQILIYEMLGSPIKQEQLDGERVLLEARDIGPRKARASTIHHFEESIHRVSRPASALVAKPRCVVRLVSQAVDSCAREATES